MRHYFPSLGALRGIAAIAVLTYHAKVFVPDWIGLLFSRGMVGVSVFFILSGFALSFGESHRESIGRFYWLRFSRIYPAFFIAWLVFCTNRTIENGRLTFAELFSVSLLQSWIPNEEYYFAVNPIFWSLSCEAFFYLLFPLLFTRTQRLSNTALKSTLAASLILIILFSVLSYIFQDYSRSQWLFTIFPPIRSLEFLFGILVAECFKRRILQPPVFPVSILIFFVFYLLTFFLPSELSRAFTSAPTALLILSLCYKDLASKIPPFSRSLYDVMGNSSFAVYLFHPIVLSVLSRTVFPTSYLKDSAIAFVFVFSSVLFSLTLGFLFFRFFERPIYLRLAKVYTANHG